MKSAEDITANALARASLRAAANNPEKAFHRGFDGGKKFEREAIAVAIENMDEGPLITKAVKAYIAAEIRRRHANG